MIPFEVRLRTGRGRDWRTFREPVAVLRAMRPEEVAGCLDDVDRAVRDDGCYAAGFVTYEAAAGFGMPTRERAADGLPLVCFGLFTPDCVDAERTLPAGGAYEVGEWRPSIDRGAYDAATARIRALIDAGPACQINFTFRLTASFEGDPLALVRDLDMTEDSPWGAYVDDGRYAICSASPELFFSIDGDRLQCRPLKGTAPRGLWAAADREREERLRKSEEDRAANMMVVNIVRGDLGRIARPGSVGTMSVFDVERHPLQWQMTSSLRARAQDRALLRLFEALFPSGSVTGAPRHSSMTIIREVETQPRGIYTGAIGYLSPHGRAHFNVAIHTIAIDRRNGEAKTGTGSDAVARSIAADDYDACLLTPSVLLKRHASSYAAGSHPDFRLLETIGWAPPAGFALLERHLDRLRASADCFGFECDTAEVRTLLENTVADLEGPSRIRVLLSRDGAIVCEGLDLPALPARPLRVALAAGPIDTADVFLYHKTTRRGLYERARAARTDADAVLLQNAHGEVTEATEANVVASIDGQKLTPPIACGLLAGTLRAELLEAGEIIERRLTVADVRAAADLWLINSVRGWMKATLLP